jgi:hypothetical protein
MNEAQTKQLLKMHNPGVRKSLTAKKLKVELVNFTHTTQKSR